jgi:hypothetical protein
MDAGLTAEGEGQWRGGVGGEDDPNGGDSTGSESVEVPELGEEGGFQTGTEAGQESGADGSEDPGPGPDNGAETGEAPGDESGAEVDPETGEDGDPESGEEPEPDSGEETGDLVPEPAVTARYIRVTTNVSPSWVAWSEVEVIGRWAGSGDVPTNLAGGGSASASSQTPEGLPALAIDGDPATSWNAGDFPEASWTLDLGNVAEIDSIRLRVAQSPPGVTKHALEAGSALANLEALHVFQGATSHGDWLVWPGEEGDPGTSPGSPDPSGLPRGITWVRTNPMFISGLTVSMGAPSPTVASEYLDGFNATAVHTWNDGLSGAIDAWMSAGGPETRWFSWVNDAGKTMGPSGEVIGGKGANPPGRIGYQVGDEPGLNGDGMIELQEIEVGVDAVRAADPDALIVVNFSFWADDFDALLDYFGGVMDADVYSYDRYAMDYKEHETLAQIRSAGLKWDRPYWRYLRSFHYVTEGKKYVEKDYRWHAFVGLLYGYTGHTWFVYQAAPPHDVASDFYPAQGDFQLPKLEEWTWAANINLELREVGRVITQLTSTDIRYIPGQSLYLPDGLVKWSAGAGDDPFIESIEAAEGGLFDVRDLGVGFFEDDEGEGYIMVQNQNHPGASFPIDNAKATTVEILFNFANASPDIGTGHVIRLNPQSGEEEAIGLVSAPGGKMKLSVSLPAAEILFFKYANGKPFPKGP